jgi:hydrogenase maturation factor
MEAQEFQSYWEAMHHEFERLGIAVIAGHTGRYMGCDYTIIGGAMLIAVGPEERYVSGEMARVGDQVIVTKGAAIAATGLLARVFPEKIEEEFDTKFLKRAQEFLYRFSVVEDALAAVSVGIHDEGVTAMHDATEGGVLGALYELATAAGRGLRVELEKIPIAPEAQGICELFEIDPYTSLSEGTLLITVRSKKAQDVVEVLDEKGIPAAIVGEILPPEKGLQLIERKGGEIRPLEHPGEDPYWQAFWRAKERGWH